ncbi:MAG: hypothetical protein ACXV2C_04915 [Candidatus Bathyarchaeia archaeon]
MLPQDCDGCSQLRPCNNRCRKVAKGGKVYCPDGTAHLVDEGADSHCIDLYERYRSVPISPKCFFVFRT